MERTQESIRIHKINLLLKELFRKSIHLCSAIIQLLLKYFFLPVIILLFLAVIGYTVSEILRLKGKRVPLISKITELAARKRDENKFVLGPVTLVIGILIAAICLPLQAATIGIYALDFGDGLASLSGKLFGKIHIPFTKGKTAAGSLACLTAVFITSFFAQGNTAVIIQLAFSAMILELIPLADFDNILIPITIGGLSLLI